MNWIDTALLIAWIVLTVVLLVAWDHFFPARFTDHTIIQRIQRYFGKDI